MEYGIIFFLLCVFLVIAGSIGSYITQKTKCPSCAEVIEKKAVKCPHCAESVGE